MNENFDSHDLEFVASQAYLAFRVIAHRNRTELVPWLDLPISGRTFWRQQVLFVGGLLDKAPTEIGGVSLTDPQFENVVKMSGLLCLASLLDYVEVEIEDSTEETIYFAMPVAPRLSDVYAARAAVAHLN